MRNLAFALVISLPILAQAELSKCGSIWTNRPCSDLQVASLPEKLYIELSGSEKDMKQREQWLIALEGTAFRANNRYRVDIDLEVTRGICLSPSSTLHECREAILSKEKQISDGIIVSKESKSETPHEADLADNFNVTIVDNRDYYRPLWRRHRHNRPSHNHGISDGKPWNDGVAGDDGDLGQGSNPNLPEQPVQGDSKPISPGNGRFKTGR